MNKKFTKYKFGLVFFYFLSCMTSDENSLDPDGGLGLLQRIQRFVEVANSSANNQDDSNLNEDQQSSPTLDYPLSNYSFVVNTAIPEIQPISTGLPFEECISDPELPDGLVIDSENCNISGIPTNSQPPSTYAITATNSFGSGIGLLDIEITVTGIPPTISYTGSPFSFIQNSAISNLIPNLTGNTPTNCESSPPLPTGLIIDPITCVISGTPTNTSITQNYTITATNASGSDNTNIDIAVVVPPPTLQYIGGNKIDSSLTNFTFNNVAFGNPDPNRLLVIVASGVRDVGGTVSTATIGGVGATIHLNTNQGSGSSAIVSAVVPNGIDGNVNIEWTVQQIGTDIQVYRLTNLQSFTPAFTHEVIASPLTQTISVSENTAVIANAKSWTGLSDIAWSGSAGLIKDSQVDFIGATFFSSASFLFTSAENNIVITATPDGGSIQSLRVIAFQ
ncbi:Ig domain-containing protein [Leptospira sp. GIMC2001]|uniref:Ig domain-containing protein n=1 Tax=Leptospira sp. GIMC2001 TaxID=1513297 RepID=UPI002349E162|nr:Ig domain-containing protein [Leptospira sp. GIMC2001]WCL50120.1 Ig domain-containing protein [Leptospira sp. GIMC2001]